MPSHKDPIIRKRLKRMPEHMEKKIKFLIVDDSQLPRMIIKQELEALGYSNVIEAENGNHGFSALEKGLADNAPISIVFSDWNMPEMSGIEFLTKIRKDERFKDIPFIMVTTEGELGKVIQAMEDGVTEYITKPFTRELLRSKIARFLSKFVAPAV